MALDLDALVNAPAADPRHFAVPFAYTPPSGGPPITLGANGDTLTGIFDNAYQDLKISGDGAAISTVGPALGVQLSAFPPGISPAQNGQVAVGGNLYTISDMKLDGLGWAQLMLSLAQG